MSNKVIASIAILMWLLTLEVHAETSCGSPRAEPWSDKRLYVMMGCRFSAVSRDGILTFLVDERGNMSVSRDRGEGLFSVRPKHIDPPAMFAWSPTSDAFFVGEGQGSGMTSYLRVYVRQGSSFAENSAFQTKAVQLYRQRTKCSRDAADPDVWPLGWSKDGSLLYLYVQATVNAPCGDPSAFLGLEMDVRTGSIKHAYSAKEAKHQFQGLLPKKLQ
jgi:hypothetical protein